MSDQALFVLMVFIIALLMSQAFVSPLMGSSAQAKRRLRGRIRDLSDGGRGAAARDRWCGRNISRICPRWGSDWSRCRAWTV